MEHKLEIRQMFDEAFKRQVIEEYLSTGCTKMELLRKYNIHFKSAIQTWMKKLGYSDPYELKPRRFASINTLSLASIPNDKDADLTNLQKRIKELEKQLLDEQLRSEAYLRMIQKAEQELKVSIRKKTNTR